MTEITPKTAIAYELRHLDGIKGNFMVSESEYLAPLILFEKGQIAAQIIYSNIKEIVEQPHHVSDSLWNKAIPAEQRIRDIEEGVKPDVIESTRDPYEVQKIAFNHVKSCRAEI